MPIRTHCPSCRADYTLADHLAGKTVRCKQCNETFNVRSAKADVGTETDENPSGRAAEDRESIQTRAGAPKRPFERMDEEPRRSRRRNRAEEVDVRTLDSGSNRGLMIGLIACAAGLLLLLVGGVIVVVYVVTRESDNTNPPRRSRRGRRSAAEVCAPSRPRRSR